MKTFRYIIIVLVLGLAIVSFVAYRMYNKKHIEVMEQEAQFKIEANTLFDAFDSNESAAGTKYSDQVLEVSGTIYSIDLSNDLEPQIVLNTDDISGYIRCGFKKNAKAKVETLKEGNPVTIKGICKGFNAADGLDLIADKDVIVSSCIIIE